MSWPMSTHRRRATSSPARLVWGGIALLVLLALIGSVMLSRTAVRDQEQAAQARAVAYVHDVLFDALTPHLVGEPILGPNYREIIISVQAGILSDDRVARIRIWKTDGTLVFSSDQRDRIGEFVAQDSPQIGSAADGSTVSLVTQAKVAPKSGLAGADEKLYETFVPLRLLNELGISGVVQIDQRYSAIQSAADRVWRPVQIGLALALLAALVLLVRSFRRPVAETVAEAPRDVRVSPPASPSADVPSQLRAAEARAEIAERAHREVQARLDAELSAKATRAASVGASSPSGVSIVELEAKLHDAEIELNAKLGAAEAEREHLSGEVQRLRAALVERDGELAIAREGTGQAEAARAAEIGRATERRTSELEQRSHAAEQRAMVAEQRVSEIEAELRIAVAARGSLETAARKTAADGEAKAGAELRQAQLELNALRSKLAEAERRAAETEARLKVLAERATKAETAVAAAEAGRKEAEAAKGAVEADRAAVAKKAGAAERSVAEVAELEARVAELEELRRSEVSELQHAQETLANTQVEATQAAKRAKEAEARVRELEETARAAAENVPEPTYEVAEEFRQPSITSRLAALHREPAPEAKPTDEGDAAPPDEGLSLRERLARAAAARHRPSGTGES